jgi:hypothetical protein
LAARGLKFCTWVWYFECGHDILKLGISFVPEYSGLYLPNYLGVIFWIWVWYFGTGNSILYLGEIFCTW